LLAKEAFYAIHRKTNAEEYAASRCWA